MKYHLALTAAAVAVGLVLTVAPTAAPTHERQAAVTAPALALVVEATAPAATEATSTAIRPVEGLDSVAVGPPRSATTPTVATTAAADSRQAYLEAMYVAVVPGAERAALAGHYVIGYDLAGMSCGTGCSGRFGTEARSSFSSAFFAVSTTYQRNLIAHEAAHAYGFLFIAGYATANWATAGGWQAQFHAADRSFVGTYDAEAWAACVAWKQSGFNNRVNQVSQICTEPAAALALAHI